MKWHEKNTSKTGVESAVSKTGTSPRRALSECFRIGWLSWFPGGSDDKESACNARDPGSIPRWGRSPGGGHGDPLQYPCLENPMVRGAWWAAVHRVAKSWM